VKVCGWALLMSTLPSSFSYKLIAKTLFEEGREKLVNRKFVFCLVVGLTGFILLRQVLVTSAT